MSHTCDVPGCGRPVDDAHACEPCRGRLDAVLGEVPALTDELRATLARETRLAVNIGRASADTPLVVNLAAGRALSALYATLALWASYTARQAPRDAQERAQALPRGRPGALAGWLMGQTELLRHLPDAGRAIDAILGASHHGWQLVDLPEHRTTFAVGPCPELIDGEPCAGEVRAYIPRDPHTVATLACPACESVWYPWQWSRAGARILVRQRELRHARSAHALAQVAGDLTESA